LLQQAFNLAMNAGIIVKDTVEPLIGKAASEARALALECNVLTDETRDALLAKAEAQATAIQQLVQ
jgi:large subunit ribosomal protein L10